MSDLNCAPFAVGGDSVMSGLALRCLSQADDDVDGGVVSHVLRKPLLLPCTEIEGLSLNLLLRLN